MGGRPANPGANHHQDEVQAIVMAQGAIAIELLGLSFVRAKSGRVR